MRRLILALNLGSGGEMANGRNGEWAKGAKGQKEGI